MLQREETKASGWGLEQALCAEAEAKQLCGGERPKVHSLQGSSCHCFRAAADLRTPRDSSPQAFSKPWFQTPYPPSSPCLALVGVPGMVMLRALALLPQSPKALIRSPGASHSFSFHCLIQLPFASPQKV